MTLEAQYPNAARQAAAEFWRQFEVPVDYSAPWKLKGTVEALRETKNHAGEWVPRLGIRGELVAPGDEFKGDLRLLIVTAHPSRLAAELSLACPALGDRIWIEYLGEDEKAPPGMNRTKRFAVETRPPGPPPPPGPRGTSGNETPTENSAGAGSDEAS